MSKTIIPGTLTASVAFAQLPLTAATAQPPASVKTALWAGLLVAGASPSIAGPAERDGHERNDRHDRPGRDARRERRPNRAASAAPADDAGDRAGRIRLRRRPAVRPLERS
jgi:hypothetical protein